VFVSVSALQRNIKKSSERDVTVAMVLGSQVLVHKCPRAASSAIKFASTLVNN